MDEKHHTPEFVTRSAVDPERDDHESGALAEAYALLAQHPAVDLHVDTLGHGSARDILKNGALHAAPMRAKEGCFGVLVTASWIPPHLEGERGWALWEKMMAELLVLRSSIAAEPDRGPALRLVAALEDARMLASDSRGVDRLASSGVVYVTLVWNTGNVFATSWEDTRSTVGLTAAGKDLVEALASRHVRVDLSHLSDRAARDVIEISPEPPLASHSSARALSPHPRNVSDALARAIAARGGVVGVNVYPAFLGLETRRVTIEHVADHVEHLRNVAGEEAVAFGSDFDGISLVPSGLEGSHRFPHLLACLLRRGHSTGFLARFARSNALRVLETTPAFAGAPS